MSMPFLVPHHPRRRNRNYHNRRYKTHFLPLHPMALVGNKIAPRLNPPSTVTRHHITNALRLPRRNQVIAPIRPSRMASPLLAMRRRQFQPHKHCASDNNKEAAQVVRLPALTRPSTRATTPQCLGTHSQAAVPVSTHLHCKGLTQCMLLNSSKTPSSSPAHSPMPFSPEA